MAARLAAAGVFAAGVFALEHATRPGEPPHRALTPLASLRRRAAQWLAGAPPRGNHGAAAAAAAVDLVEAHLTSFRRQRTALPSAPLDIEFDSSSSELCLSFALPPSADYGAVLGSALGVTVASVKRSTPLDRLLGQVTMRDAMEGAEYALESRTVHRTAARSGACEVVLRRDIASGEASLEVSSRQPLGDRQARALANAYAVSHGGGRSAWAPAAQRAARRRGGGVARRAEGLGLLEFEHDG